MKHIERIYPWLLLTPLLLPVVVWSGLIYPYLVPKTLLFYAISLLSLATFLLIFTHHTFFWGRLRTWVTWVPAALLGVAYATSLVGIDFYRSFWSIFTRGDGLLMFTGVVTSFYLILLSADQHFFTRFIRGVALVASFVALYGIGEWLFSGGGRIGGLLGNAAFFAGYLGTAFFTTLLAAYGLHGSMRRTARVGALLQLVAIVLTATRGTILALLVAGFGYLIYSLFVLKGKGRTYVAWILVALVASGALFFTFRSQLVKVPFEPISRIASISASDNDVASRLFVWKHMVNEIAKSPWRGVGAEHIDVLFNRFYDPTQISEQWFDRSHNAFLDYLAQFGLFGLALYLALIGAYGWVARRMWKKGRRQEAALVSLIALTYAVQNFFVFDTVSSLWLFVALLAGLIASVTHDVPRERLPLPVWMRSASWLIALVLVYLIYPVTIQPGHAAYDLAHAYLYQLVDAQKETSYLASGFALETYGGLEYGYEAYDMYVNTQMTRLAGDARTTAYGTALKVLTTNFTRYAYDARTALYLAHVLSFAPAGVTVDQGLLSSALARAINLSPKRAQPWYILENLSISSANTYPPQSSERAAGYAAARDIMGKYIAMVPKLSLPHYVLAELLYATGDIAGAAAEATKGRQYYHDDLETATRAVGYYETILDLPNAAYFLKEILRIEPTNTSAAADLQKIQFYESSKH